MIIERMKLYIFRKKNHVISIFLLIFALSSVVAVFFSIYVALIRSDEYMRISLESQVTILYDYEKAEEVSDDTTPREQLSLNLIKEISELEYVENFDYQLQFGMQSDNLKRYAGNENNIINTGNYYDITGTQNVNVDKMPKANGKISLGRSFLEQEILDGESVVIIGEGLAIANDLMVGEYIEFKNIVYGYTINEMDQPIISEEIISLEIIGIISPQEMSFVEDPGQGRDNQKLWEYEQRQNIVIVPNKIIENIYAFQLQVYESYGDKFIEYIENSNQGLFYQPIYELTSTEEIIEFKKMVVAMIPSYYKIETSIDQYEEIANELTLIKKIFSYSLISIISVSIIILSIFINFLFNERKNEWGIYYSLGESRVKIFSLFIFPILLISFFAISFSLICGNMIAHNISDTIIINQISYFQNSEPSGYYENSYFSNNISNIDIISSMDMSLSMNLTYAVNMYIISIVTVLFSTIVSIFSLFRLNPKQILLE